MPPPTPNEAYQEVCPFVHSKWYKVQKLAFCLEGSLYMLQILNPQKPPPVTNSRAFTGCILHRWFTYFLVKVAKVLAPFCSSDSVSILLSEQ